MSNNTVEQLCEMLRNAGYDDPFVAEQRTGMTYALDLVLAQKPNNQREYKKALKQVRKKIDELIRSRNSSH